jgi:hypothetical protein
MAEEMHEEGRDVDEQPRAESYYHLHHVPGCLRILDDNDDDKRYYQQQDHELFHDPRPLSALS